MNQYSFETREFGLSDKGMHLLRSRFNYETIEFNHIGSLRIEKGKELNNWFVILTIGLVPLAFASYYSWRIFQIIVNREVSVISIEEILVPLIPLMLGGYCVYSSTRNGTVMRVRTIENVASKFPLKEIEEKGQLEELKRFLQRKLDPAANRTI